MKAIRHARGAALLAALGLIAGDASGAAERDAAKTTDRIESTATAAAAADMPSVAPSRAPILIAQVEDDGAAARRRRRPSFRRPGGGRGDDAGAPEEASPPRSESVAPPEPVVQSVDEATSGGEPEEIQQVAPSEVEVAPTPFEPVPVTVDEVAPAPVVPSESEAAPPRRPAPVRPGSSRDDSSGAPPPRPRERPSRIATPTYENELPDYEFVAVPDRWRIVENLGVNERWYDPYNQNTLKADRPIPGTEDWFFNLNLVYDGFVEPRRIPTPTGVAGDKGRETDLFGDSNQLAWAHNFITSLSVLQGDTTFRPPDWEFRVTTAINVNHAQINQLGVLRVDPRENNERYDWFVGLQEAFVDKHLWNRTDRFDFDSLRVGIQPFNADFRGFLFESSEPGVRLFGNFGNNRAQYNLAVFGRLNKDTNSGLNNVQSWRDDYTAIANFYYQDFPVLGFNVEAIFAANINRESDRFDYDDNSNLVIPAPVGLGRGHDYEVYYIGFGGDGHIDRLNLTYMLYGALGQDDFNSIAQRSQDIRSFFAAIEASVDFDWMRYKAFFLYSMGDDDPYDGTAQGFDTILDNPNFAGATTSFWQRQQIPFVFGGGVALSGVNSIVPSLRSSKFEGQSNFVNPGLWQVGAGADFDVLPQLRLLTNVSWLSWDSVQVLEILRQQQRISREIGWDLSAGLIYRPLFSNNIVLRVSGAVLIPVIGYQERFPERCREPPFSVLANLTLTF